MPTIVLRFSMQPFLAVSSQMWLCEIFCQVSEFDRLDHSCSVYRLFTAKITEQVPTCCPSFE